MAKEKLTAENLKNTLWATLNEVKRGKIQPLVANSVATQSREILRVIKAEVSIARLANRSPAMGVLTFSKGTQIEAKPARETKSSS